MWLAKGLEYVNIANGLMLAKYAKISRYLIELHLQPIWRVCFQTVLKPARAFRRSRPHQPSAPGSSTAAAHKNASMAKSRDYAKFVVAHRYASMGGGDMVVWIAKGLEYVNTANSFMIAKYAKLSQGMRGLHLQPIWRGCLQPVLKPTQAFRRSRPLQPSTAGLEATESLGGGAGAGVSWRWDYC